MDFSLPYTEEQQRFRLEVRAWIEENIPEEKRDPIDNRDFDEEMFHFWRQKHKDLAAKGWLYPTFPKEYGGGGLTGDHETIIAEEFLRGRVPRNTIGPEQVPLILATLLVWATEEQKQRFLIPLLNAGKIAWQKFTEPHSGADLANYQSTAVRDGDDWILNGSNVFISGRVAPDWIFGPMVTDPDAPRHRNLGFFMIPVPSPGLEIRSMNLLSGNDQNFIFLDNVRVPGDHLIGGDHQGWQVANTSLEQEHGGRGSAFPSDEVVDNLIAYTQEAKRNGDSLGKDPVVQQIAISAYLEAHVQSLLAKRTFWDVHEPDGGELRGQRG